MIKEYNVLNKNHSLLFHIPELTIESPGIYIFSGDNGVGKTTLLNLLSSINNPDLMEPAHSTSLLHVRQDFQEKMSYLYQPGFLFEGTVRENITFGETDEPFLQELAGILLIKDLDKEISFNPINLSLGEQQKTFLARTFFQKTDIILLDEPLSNLDAEAKKRLIEYLYSIKLKKTILIVTHDPAFKQMADVCYEIQNQQIKVIKAQTA